ncbi:hypothetical protein C8Q76DRAFT_469069 [Earliella scabrosa]|nr:hypothetical protein C8Q76DRAFT_469069 [Earliella scabrosa]
MSSSQPLAGDMDRHLLSLLPEAYRNELDTFSNKAKIVAWISLRTREEENKSLKRILFEIHNSLIPIHTIYAETLIHILTLSQGNWECFYLTHVCRRWRSLVLATPAFWAEIARGINLDAKHPPPQELYPAIITRSSPVPIKLVLSHFPPTMESLFLNCCSRLYSIQVRVTGMRELGQLHHAIQSANLEMLEDLRIEYCMVDAESPEDQDLAQGLAPLAPGALPRMRRLRIPFLLLNLYMVPTVQDVSLEWLTGHWHTPTLLLTALALLATSPVLETLTLETGNCFTESPEQPPVYLPSIRNLSVRGWNVDMTVAYLRVPSTAHIHLELDTLTRVIHTNHPDAVSSLLSPCNAMSMVTHDEARCVLSAQITYNGTERLRIDQTSLSSIGSVLPLIVSRNPAANLAITHLTIVLPPWCPQADLQELVWSLPNLSALDICGSLDTAFFHGLHRCKEGGGLYNPLLCKLSVGWVLQDSSGMVDCVYRDTSTLDPESPVGPKELLHWQTVATALAKRAKQGGRLESLVLYECLYCSHREHKRRPPRRVVMSEVRQAALEKILKPLKWLVDGEMVYKGYVSVGREYADRTWRPSGFFGL